MKQKATKNSDEIFDKFLVNIDNFKKRYSLNEEQMLGILLNTTAAVVELSGKGDEFFKEMEKHMDMT